ncbi:MAG: acetoacetate--CoA ligase [Gammaproteobacteria bacterium]|nr:acetoacetate--CoA ligase [Gammaproteobacteria bacterium]
MSGSHEPLWTPSPERVANSNLRRFLEYVQQEHSADANGYGALYDWSVENPAAFWASVWRFCGVRASIPWEQVLVDGARMPGARWFVGSRLNFAENLLRRRGNASALIFQGEDGRRRELKHGELYDSVSRAAQALKRAGVQPGDRVAGYLPNVPETVISMLAATSLGAVWSSCSPDFGKTGVLERFGQIAPKVLITADGYRYAGKRIALAERQGEILRELPSIERVVVVPFVGDIAPVDDPRALAWDVWLEDFEAQDIDFVHVPFDHPLYVMYSSGTTGKPKCIVHGVGGTLLQHLKELVLHTDLHPNERIFYFTTCGWMMWNWLVSALAAEATLVLFDGSPFHPQPQVLMDLAEQEGINVFGTSAKYLSALEKAGGTPVESHDLTALRTVLSTGSPLAPESFTYVYEKIKPDVQLSSISGGTDLISCFALGSPMLPVYRGELQCRGLGLKVEVYDDDGRSLVGEKGELVCTQPFPSMPIGFWDDADGERYRDAYFAKYDNVWAHGDYAEITERGGVIIYGRSDAVLNPGGVRIGTAEIYRQVEKLTEVLESIAVGQDWDNDVRIILFVRLRDRLMLDDALTEKIKLAIRAGASPRHVPAKVIQVADIPRTISGKIVELAVRNVIHGQPVNNTDALANAEALELYKDLPELTQA